MIHVTHHVDLIKYSPAAGFCKKPSGISQVVYIMMPNLSIERYYSSWSLYMSRIEDQSTEGRQKIHEKIVTMKTLSQLPGDEQCNPILPDIKIDCVSSTTHDPNRFESL